MKVLVLDNSQVTAELFEEAVENENISLTFENSFEVFLKEISEINPELILINANFHSPSGIEIARTLKSIEELNEIKIGLYCNANFSFEKNRIDEAGADVFVHITNDDYEKGIRRLLGIVKEEKNVSVPEIGMKSVSENAINVLEHFSKKTAVLQNVYSQIKSLDSIEKIAGEFLNLICETGEVPCSAIIIKDSLETSGYYVKAGNITDSEIEEFLNVCKSDFDNLGINAKNENIKSAELPATKSLENYRVLDEKLSCYEFFEMRNSANEIFATVHVISENSFTPTDRHLMSYCTSQSALLFENAQILKKKIFFEKRIRRAFSRFVPEQIIDDLVSSDFTDKVSVGEKRNVAVLFSDIRSFTNISECNKPEVIVSFLNRYFTIMVNIIKKHGGTIDKFIGDAIMALFGAPVSYEDNCRRAVAAACEMRKALDTVSTEGVVLPNGMKFSIGIGINYGDVIVGSIGSNDKTDYSVIGDNVNLASRLEGLTKTYGSMILISDSTKKDIEDSGAGDDFSIRYLDDVKVKGKAKSVPIYGVDSSPDEFPPLFKDCYSKGMELYKQGIFHLAKEYFEKALAEVPEEKASSLMLERCKDFIENPPENWDGSITFKTK